MKFKELPEGHYYIHGVGGIVYVEKLESPETYPRHVIELETIKVTRGGKDYRRGSKILDDLEVGFKTREDIQKERKARNASYGHIKRRILADEPLTGKTLKLALDLVTPIEQREGDKHAEFCNGIAKKLKAGQPLDDYEAHMMVDVFLLHARLAD